MRKGNMACPFCRSARAIKQVDQNGYQLLTAHRSQTFAASGRHGCRGGARVNY